MHYVTITHVETLRRTGAWAAPILPYLLAFLVLAAYTAVFAARARQSGGDLAFAVLGTANTPGHRGYDGQYYYRIAVDPLGGTHGLDRPAYRYQRILYPLLARLAALGRRERIAAALVLVNAAAIAAGVLLVALLLRRNALSPLYALACALYAGQVGSFWRDLAEPLAFALVAAALLLLGADRPRLAALALLAAALTKETALLFVAPLAFQYILRRSWRVLATLLALVAMPYALWQAALWIALGQPGIAGADHPPLLPLGGLSGARGLRQWLFDLEAVAIPALLCLLLCCLSLRRAWLTARGSLSLTARRYAALATTATAQGVAHRSRLARATASMVDTMETARRALGDLPSLLLLANLAFVLWLPARSYADLWASARNAQGLVLAALSCPALAAPRLRWPLVALWGCSAPLLWLQ